MSSPLLAITARKKAYGKGLVIVGLILLGLGAYTIYDSQSISTYHSTFNILPSKLFKITDNLKDTATINGGFKEFSGRPITFLIMNSLQFAAYQIGQGNSSLYMIVNQASGSISFTFPATDTYFLIFLHGSGYLTVTETIDFQRSYISPGRFELYSGIGLIGIAVVELFWGFRPSTARPRPSGLQKQSETPNEQS